MVPQCRPFVSRVFIAPHSARERDEERARLCMFVCVCMSARARQGSQRGSYRMRNWWNAVPGQPTNTVGTVA